MNTFDIRRFLPDNAAWPVDIAIRHNLIEPRAGAYIDDVENDFDDDDRRLVEYFRSRFRLTKENQ